MFGKFSPRFRPARCESPDFDLIVEPAEELEVAVGQKRAVAGAVDPGPRFIAERMGDELFGGELGAVSVARVSPSPPMCSSPATPIGTGFSCASRI